MIATFTRKMCKNIKQQMIDLFCITGKYLVENVTLLRFTCDVNTCLNHWRFHIGLLYFSFIQLIFCQHLKFLHFIIQLNFLFLSNEIHIHLKKKFSSFFFAKHKLLNNTVTYSTIHCRFVEVIIDKIIIDIDALHLRKTIQSIVECKRKIKV